MNFRAVFAAIDMTPVRFVMRYVAPVTVGSAAVAWGIWFAAPYIFSGPLLAIPILFPFVALGLLLAYPIIRAQEMRALIDRNIHFFITHLGVLATSNIPRADIFQILGEKIEYGVVAVEAKRIHALVKRWNLSLADAARFVSRRTPSRIFSDFLARLAHALDSGEDLPAFLANEQVTVMHEYAHAYRRKLYGAEVFKALYNSLVLTLAFLFIFALLMPTLLGMDVTVVLGTVLLVVIAIETALIQAARGRAPTDPVWHREPRRRSGPALAKAAAISTAGCIVIAVPVALVGPPLPLAVALVVSPLALVGVMAARFEGRIQRREENYAAFIRSLGASASAHGNQVRPVLKQLQYHDFGPLRDDVTRLYRRLQLRADDARAWDLFGNESDSHLVLFFNRMFEEGLANGGEPDTIGHLMSKNFNQLLALRKERYQMATNFRGLAFGLVIALAAALSVGSGTVHILASSLSSFDVDNEVAQGILPKFGTMDFAVADRIVLAALVLHSGAAAAIVSILRGSHPLRSASDFVLFTWGTAGVLLVAQKMFAGFT